MTQGNNTYLVGQVFVPQFLLVSNITKATQMVVTVTTPNNYIVGQNIYFSIPFPRIYMFHINTIPFPYGMFQVNGLMGNIVAVDVTNLIFTVDINSTQFDAFVTPSGVRVEQPATVSSQGSKNTYNFVQLPFHAVNGANFGN